MPFNPTTFNVKDAAAADKSMIAFNDGTKNAFANAVLKADGTLINPATAENQATAVTHLSQIETATETTASALAAANASLDAIEAATANIPTPVGSRMPVDGSAVTQPISATALPLPTGAATASNQAAANVLLDEIATNTTGVSTAANQGALNANIGAQADPAASSDTGTFSLIALFKRSLQSLTSLLSAVYDTYRPRFPAAVSFTRPADTSAYTFGDLVANSTTAGSVVPLTIAAARGNDITGVIAGGFLRKSSNTTSRAIFRVHIFTVLPTVANGDNGAFQPANMDGYLGSFDCTMSAAGTSGAVGQLQASAGMQGLCFNPSTGTQNLFALIEARDAYIPASGETLTLQLFIF